MLYFVIIYQIPTHNTFHHAYKTKQENFYKSLNNHKNKKIKHTKKFSFFSFYFVTLISHTKNN